MPAAHPSCWPFILVTFSSNFRFIVVAIYGPRIGIWTQEQEKKKKHKASRKRSRDESCKDKNEQQQPVEPPPSMDFASARPTFTHRAITQLINVGTFHFCVTQVSITRL